MKLSGNCPDCKAKVTFDLDKEIKTKEPRQLENQTSETKQVLLEKPIEKEPEIKIETVIEDIKPNYECPDGDCPVGIHKNKNYKKKPKGKCTNCDQFTKNKDGTCPWCKGTDIEELDPEDLDELGILNPPEVEHTHE